METGKLFFTILAVITLIIFIGGLSVFFIRKTNSRHSSLKFENVSSTLKKALLIVWYPIQTIVELFHGLFYRFYSFVHDLFDTEQYQKNKTQKLVRYAVSTVLHSQSNLLNTYLNRSVANALTLLLQIVSFFTTYAGFTFFLGTVNPVAPLFVAITVQGGCYYLLNYTSAHKRQGAIKRNVLLGFLILTSIITSYMGIFDGVVRPVEKMESQYKNYVNVVESIINDEIVKKHYNYIDFNQIEGSLDVIKNTYEDACQSIETLMQESNSLVTTKKIQNSWIDAQGEEHIYIEEVDDTDALNKKAELDAEKTDLQTSADELSYYLENAPSANDLHKACENIINDPKKITDDNDMDKIMWNDLKETLYECDVLYEKLHPDRDNEVRDYYETIKLDKVTLNHNNREALEELRLAEFDIVVNKQNNESGSSENYSEEAVVFEYGQNDEKSVSFKKILAYLYNLINELNEVVVSKDATKAQEIRNTINKTINDNYSKLSTLIQNSTNYELLQSAKEAAYIENTQIMPFKSPFTDKNIRGEVIFSFVTAFLVDFFSLFISFALLKKQKSILYFKKVGQLQANREEMLEDCLMYICLNSLHDENNGEKTMNRFEIQDLVVKKINEVMQKFMKKIKPIYLSDELNVLGYFSEEQLNNFDEDEKRLFFTLSNVALIHPCHQSEIIKIVSADFDEYLDNKESNANKALLEKYKSIFEEKKIYYLVSKNLHVWICENFSELLQSSLLSDSQKVYDAYSDNIEMSENGGDQNA